MADLSGNNFFKALLQIFTAKPAVICNRALKNDTRTTTSDKKTAFSLVELSIVVTVIGVMIAGIIGATGMIKAASISGARSFTLKSSVSQISGLVAWYETSLTQSLKSSEAFDGAAISTWFDISPTSITNRRNTLSRSASNDLIYQENGINNLPSLKFNGKANLVLNNFYESTSDEHTIFFVARPYILGSNTGTIIDSANASASTTSIAFTNTGIRMFFGVAATASGTNISSGQDYIVATYANGSASKVYINNAAATIGNAINPGNNILQGLTVGTDKNSAAAFTGLISEIIIFNRPLHLQERRDIFKYLSYKYNITVNGI